MLFIIKQTLGVYCAASHTLYFTLNNSDGSVFQQLRLKYPEIFTMLDTEKTVWCFFQSSELGITLKLVSCRWKIDRFFAVR